MQLRRTQQIGVIGLTQSGKTTFITSLLAHWKNYKPNLFRLGDDDLVLDLEFRGDAEVSGKRRFELNQKKISEGSWVQKTLDTESYSFNLLFGGKTRPVKIFDLPGERLADIAMAGQPSLLKWSESIVHALKRDPILEEHAKNFLTVYENASDPDEKKLERLDKEYRKLMARFARKHIPLITPSSMLVDENGKYVPDKWLTNLQKAEQWFTEECSMGIKGCPIVPLPPQFKDAKQIITLRQKYYSEYRSKVVKPALAPLQHCHDVLFLVDVAGILSNHVDWKNQCEHLIKDFIAETVSTKRIQQYTRWLTHKSTFGLATPNSHRRVTFIATQSDRVHADDQDKLEELLKDLTQQSTRLREAKNVLKVQHHVASAVKSTESDSGHRLNFLDEKTQRPATCVVSEVPEYFKDDWSTGDYKFPMTAPRIPKNKGNPPFQENLNLITKYLFNIKST